MIAMPLSLPRRLNLLAGVSTLGLLLVAVPVKLDLAGSLPSLQAASAWADDSGEEGGEESGEEGGEESGEEGGEEGGEESGEDGEEGGEQGDDDDDG